MEPVNIENSNIQQTKILNTGYTLSNIMELVTNVMLILSKKDTKESFPVNSLNRSVLGQAVANRIKERAGI